ncbi:MAG: acyl-CoA dehydrogenase family protein [Myxococcota bacterium]|nr:acyl-CoA dehydrogenase family protein [Myxococcota bacterium]
MQLVLDEDQELLAKTAADWVGEFSPVSRMRELRDTKDLTGFSKKLWKEMAELGWVGIPFDEAHGGADMGLAELVVVLEAMGRALAPEPFLSSVLLGGGALQLAGSDAQKQQWLPGVAEGDKLLALATQEPTSRYDLFHVTTRAEKSGDGWVLTGTKSQVIDGHAADAILIPARTSGADADRDGISLFLVPADAAGLSSERQWRLDSRGAGLLELSGVAAGTDALVGQEGGAAATLETVVDRATVGLCAEMLGGMTQAFELTLEHMKQREQFDTVIGTFQALKHRAAKLFIEIELSRSCVMAAARAVDSGDENVAKLVSLAKARCSDAYILATNEGVQIFGGVGMTDEYDIGLYMKRARAAALTFGDAAFHRDRWARLSNY